MSTTVPIKRGVFILLEGLDRSGKTSAATALADTLNKEEHGSALQMRFPDRDTTIGKMINAYLADGVDLDDHVIHLLFSANRWEKQAFLRTQLEQGIHVVCDRYAYSGIAFTTAKPTMQDTHEWSKAPDRGLIAPDVVLFFDVSTAEAAKRGGFGTERYEQCEMQDRVRTRFEAMLRDAAANPACDSSRFGVDVPWIVIDANQEQSQVQMHALQIARDYIVRAQAEPIKTL